MLDAVGAERRRRIQLVRGNRHAQAMGFLDDALLHQIRQPDVGLDEVEIERSRTLQHPRQLTGVVER